MTETKLNEMPEEIWVGDYKYKRDNGTDYTVYDHNKYGGIKYVRADTHEALKERVRVLEGKLRSIKLWASDVLPAESHDFERSCRYKLAAIYQDANEAIASAGKGE